MCIQVEITPAAGCSAWYSKQYILMTDLQLQIHELGEHHGSYRECTSPQKPRDYFKIVVQVCNPFHFCYINIRTRNNIVIRLSNFVLNSLIFVMY